MPSNRVMHVRPVAHDNVQAHALRAGIAAIQAEQEVSPEFPAEVRAAAEAAAAAPRLPELDRTDLPLVTIDPPRSMDLDQAMHIARDGEGYVVSYAIADLAAFISPGDPVDMESHRRGETLYGADSTVPLHPRELSEGAASLLPDLVRPALLWTLRLDASGEGTQVEVTRALVRSTAKLDYAGVQQAIDTGTASETLQLLREVGEKRIAREIERGGVSLPLPEQEVVVAGDAWSLDFRSQLPAEQWNAQISLLCGFGAATVMLGAGIGLLRTLPPADPRDVKRLRRTARGLKLDWAPAMDYPDFIRTLDPAVPAQAAMVVACARLLRGSGYVAFDGAAPHRPEHAALAAPYAHVTAPLRRLADRYTGEICVALCAGEPVPDWVRAQLPELPAEMSESGRRANRYEKAVLNLVEAGILQHRVGEVFQAVVVEVDARDDRRGDVTIEEPAIEAGVRADEPLSLGEHVRVRLTTVHLPERRVVFHLV